MKLFLNKIADKIYKYVFLAGAGSVLFLCACSTGLADVDMKFRTAINESYDDNVTYAYQNEKDDFITNLSLGADLTYEDKMQRLRMSADILREIFADNSDFDNTSEIATVDFHREFSKYDRIRLRNRFSHTYEPRSFEEAFGRTLGHYSYYKNFFSLRYTKDITKQISVNALYSNELYDISREDMSDSSLHTGALESEYYISTATVLLGGYEFSKRDFDKGADSSQHVLLGGIRQYLTLKLYFDGKAGVNFIDSYSGEEYIRPVITASLTDEMDENTSATLSYTKQHLATSYTEDIFKQWQVSAGITRRLLKRLGASFSGFYGEGRYIALNTIDKLQGYNTSFSYDIRDNIALNLGYRYSQISSNVETREYNKNTVSIKLSMEF
jgi:hypothetical protein